MSGGPHHADRITVDAPGWFDLALRLVAALELGVAAYDRSIPRRHRARLTWGTERPRTKESPMAGVVHRGAELPYDINAHDAITGAEVGLQDMTFTTSVNPPEAGLLTQPDADGKGVFRANASSDIPSAAISIRCDFGDGTEPVILSDSVEIDPDGRVVGLTWGPEQPRSA